jgi:kumamolisin
VKALSRSNREPISGFEPAAVADATEVIEVTMRVRRRQALNKALSNLIDTPLEQRLYLSREELSAKYGASPDDLVKVIEFGTKNGFSVIEKNPAARMVRFRATVGAFQRALGLELKVYRNEKGLTFRGRTGMIYVPDDLSQIIESIHGLDNREQAKPHFQAIPGIAKRGQALTLTPAQVANAYGFPKDASGSAQTVAVIEFGGGYSATDLETYFSANSAEPRVLSVSVDGGANQPSGDPQSPDIEVGLDVEILGAIATDAVIVVYFAPNTEQGFVDGIAAAIHDTENNPSIVSISWGMYEKGWTQQGMDAINQLLQDAVLLGVTVLASSGDQGSTDGVADGSLNVDFPASSPYALACGGTRLTISKSGEIDGQTAWSSDTGATGGGQSAIFSIPDYQVGNVNLDFTGRGLPDVAGNADPNTSYIILIGGKYVNVGGTSAVTPLYAGLLAKVNQLLAVNVGFLNPFLYTNAGICWDITQGSNGAYSAGPGWDATTGWGSIKGGALLDMLLTGSRGQPAAVHPVVRGPTTAPREGPPPTFTIDNGLNPYYIFEITSDPRNFGHREWRTASNFYGSWADPGVSPRLTDRAFSLPSDAWNAIRGNPTLYYRIGSTTSSDPRKWDNYLVSVTDSEALKSAPSIRLY